LAWPGGSNSISRFDLARRNPLRQRVDELVMPRRLDGQQPAR
jgi:hypothetical protein